MSEPRLNIELLKKVRDKIATTPEAYDQAIWGRSAEDAPCGTAACIAGWAAHLSGNVNLEYLQTHSRDCGIGDIAEDALGLETRERYVLFASYPYQEWPEPFALNWKNAVSHKERALVAVAFLDEIIETGEVRDPDEDDNDDNYDDDDDDDEDDY